MPRADRLSLLCETYGGVEPGGVLDAVASFHERDRSRTVNWGREGREPRATFLRTGELDTIADDAGWLREHAAEI